MARRRGPHASQRHAVCFPISLVEKLPWLDGQSWKTERQEALLLRILVSTERDIMLAQITSTLAAINLEPGGIIAWLVVGLIAGWLAGLAMSGSGYGIAGDIIMGLIGAFLGGLITSFFVQGSAGFVGSVIIAFIGACVLIAIARALTPTRTRI
jgi:uncharacterized membrane protein YeaQ/YmgE (transglycosylase-associated protein family)